MRKKLLLILAPVVLLAAVGTVLYFKTQSANAAIGNLQVFKGSAQIVRSGDTNTGSTGTPVRLKDRIKATSGSTVALVLKDNTIIRIEGGSEVEVAQLTYENGKVKDAQFNLINGRMWSRVKPLEKGSQFEVETPTVTAAVRGTSFNTTFKNMIIGIYVYHHVVETSLNQTRDKQPVEQSQLLQMHQETLGEDFNKGTITPPEEFFDEWIRFNQQEDDRLCRQLHDIPGCESASQPVVQAIVTPPPEPPAPPPPASAPKKKVTPPPPSVIPPAPTVESLTVKCSKSRVSNKDPVPCTATAHLSNNQTLNVTNSSNTKWSLANLPNRTFLGGTITPPGVYNPEYPGATVKATYGGKTGSFDVDATDLG